MAFPRSIFPRLGVAAILAVAALITVSAAKADTTNLPDSEIQGQALAQKILATRPSQNYTNTGRLEIRDGNGHRHALPVSCETLVTGTTWVTRYAAKPVTNEAETVTLTVTHTDGGANQYSLSGSTLGGASGATNGTPSITIPFAGSDFWLCDLGLEFFHWPQQRVIKKEFHRQCACTVLESTNPIPTPGGYSKVDCWIDNESLGIVEAYAYDAEGRRFKNFYPKDFEKVNGQYQLESMVMENLPVGSKTVLEFDLSK